MGKMFMVLGWLLFLSLFILGNNLISYSLNFLLNSSPAILDTQSSLDVAKIGFGESVKIDFFRDRFFYNMDSEKIYLINIIPLTYKIKETKIIWFQAVVGFLFLIWLVIIIFKPTRRYYGEEF